MTSLDQTETKLQSLRKSYVDRIDAIDRDLAHKNSEIEKDSAEQVTQGENDEVLAALKVEARDSIVKIDQALEKVHTGQYGQCSRCGESISSARLLAIPFAEYCIKCAAD